MISKFKKHLDQNFSFLKNKKLFLAVSAGIDSMVMLHLFQQLDYKIRILHCNFQLRGKESQGDFEFIQNYANQHEIPFSFAIFETQKYSNDNKVSIQVGARELRYGWFYEQLAEKNYDYILTAHHADDAIETFLINFSRGTGLEGLTGIPSQNKKIIRPLLNFSRQEIEDYAHENNIQWREDSTNTSDKYYRNKIRHQIVPVLKELNPGFLNSFQKTIQHLQQVQSLVDDATILIYQQVVIEEDNQKKINLNKLKKLPNYRAYLYQWLKPFGFSAWEDIYDLVESQSGKQVFSDGFRLLKDRDSLILGPINLEIEKQQFLISENQSEVNFPLKMTFCKVSDISNVSNVTIFVDIKKLQFPLVLRKWAAGDSFLPLGMNGRHKKISKLLKDEKLSLIEKEKVWLLCSNNQIVWVVGIRQDERFKINKTTQNLLQITLK